MPFGMIYLSLSFLGCRRLLHHPNGIVQGIVKDIPNCTLDVILYGIPNGIPNFTLDVILYGIPNGTLDDTLDDTLMPPPVAALPIASLLRCAPLSVKNRPGGAFCEGF